MPAKGWKNKSLYTLFFWVAFSFIALIYVDFIHAQNRATETHQRPGMSNNSNAPDEFINKAEPEPSISLTVQERVWLAAHPDIQLGYTDAFEPKVIVNTDGTGFTPLREFAGGVDDGRKPNGIGKESIISGFQKMMGLPNVLVEDQQTAFQAISWCEPDLDFADALHLASSMKADKFVSFDDAFNELPRRRAAGYHMSCRT